MFPFLSSYLFSGLDCCDRKKSLIYIFLEERLMIEIGNYYKCWIIKKVESSEKSYVKGLHHFKTEYVEKIVIKTQM